MKHIKRFNEADGFDDDHDFDPNVEDAIEEFENDDDDDEYNESNFDVEEVFTPLINWKLFRYLQDSIIDFADRGIPLSLYIQIDTKETGECDIYNDSYNYNITGNKGEQWERHCETYDEDIIFNLTHLTYGINFHFRSELSPQDLERIRRIKQDTVSKFNVEVSPIERILCEFIVNI